jgi:small neutral amino acid transporter SnatA (MarC family)
MKAFTLWLLFLNSNSVSRRIGIIRVNKSFMGSLLAAVTSSFVAGRNCMPKNTTLFA